jgi:hypothetical protein
MVEGEEGVGLPRDLRLVGVSGVRVVEVDLERGRSPRGFRRARERSRLRPRGLVWGGEGGMGGNGILEKEGAW